MEAFNIITGVASILSLIVSCFVLKKVVYIKNNVSIKDESNIQNKSQNVTSQTLQGDGNLASGGDMNVRS